MNCIVNDYYPGGMVEPGRTFGGLGRYGFNGKEQDSSINGTGVDYDYGDRILDVRIGPRWLSVDPLQRKYPGESPYAFVSGNPIVYADADGRDKIYTLTIIGKDGKSTSIRTVDKNYFVYEKIQGHGLFNNHYYKSDLIANATIDLRGERPVATYHQELSSMKEISLGDYYYSIAVNAAQKWAKSENERGSQESGVTLTSEFTTTVDGPKTDATKGSQGSVNTDAILAAFDALHESGEALKFDIGDLPEWMKLGKDIVEQQMDEKKDNNTNSPSNEQSNTNSFNTTPVNTTTSSKSSNPTILNSSKPNSTTNNNNNNTNTTPNPNTPSQDTPVTYHGSWNYYWSKDSTNPNKDSTNPN